LQPVQHLNLKAAKLRYLKLVTYAIETYAAAEVFPDGQVFSPPRGE
jgi:hypothetical protein